MDARKYIIKEALFWRKASRAADLDAYTPAVKAKFVGKYEGLRSALKIIREN